MSSSTLFYKARSRARLLRGSVASGWFWAAFLVLLAVAYLLGQRSAPATVSDGGDARTPAGVLAFIEDAERQILELTIRAELAAWTHSNFVNEDTELLSAGADYQRDVEVSRLVRQVRRFDGVVLPPALRRRLDLLVRHVNLPPSASREPGTPAAPDHELMLLVRRMQGRYAQARYCPDGGTFVQGRSEGCLDIGELQRRMSESRDPQELQRLWQGWHDTAARQRKDFARYVELANAGAHDLGFDDLGVLWRDRYDMSADRLRAELDRLWRQVRPLYEALHCHTRARLMEVYGDSVPSGEPIPAHLLGDPWGQNWNALFDLVAPAAARGTAGRVAGAPAPDLSGRLQQQVPDEASLVRYGADFFVSLGLEPLPDSFWRRSRFQRPEGRQVICHPLAWHIDLADDVRLSACIEIDAENFRMVHHELGHSFFQRAYRHQPVIFREGANAAFHEALGDTMVLSITPEYLHRLGLLDAVPPPQEDLDQLLRLALERVAFLPFGLVVDQWRWSVFAGEVSPENYTQAWWRLRREYQGVQPPVARTEADFDPGSKFHVIANVPYIRYFFSNVLQYQFHRGLCQAAGVTGPLHRCSLYGETSVGERLSTMMEMGASRPWPDALEALTGEREMDATAMLEYFAPLVEWLEKENKGRECGW